MKYIEFVNKIINEKVGQAEKIILFGQNIDAGSCISGLTRNLKIKDGGLIINTPNCENTLCGVGFGLMLNGVSSLFFMKQQDFLLLGIDHLVNTYNFVRRDKPLASFTIVCVVMDSGYEGAQHSLNNFSDFCSIARVPGFTITNSWDVEEIIKTHLVAPGFRIIGVSQRLFNKEIIEVDRSYSNNEKTIFKYKAGSDVTIVCFNFSFPYGLELYNRLREKKISASIFSVNTVTPIEWTEIVEDLKNTKNLIIIDDSKSVNLSWNNFLVNVYEKCQIKNKIIIKKEFSDKWYYPNSDQLEINYDDLVDKLLKNLPVW